MHHLPSDLKTVPLPGHLYIAIFCIFFLKSNEKGEKVGKKF